MPMTMSGIKVKFGGPKYIPPAPVVPKNFVALSTIVEYQGTSFTPPFTPASSSNRELGAWWSDDGRTWTKSETYQFNGVPYLNYTNRYPATFNDIRWSGSLYYFTACDFPASTFWFSTDGTSWTKISGAGDEGNPYRHGYFCINDTIYAWSRPFTFNSSYSLYKSTDFGKTWVYQTGSTNNIYNFSRVINNEYVVSCGGDDLVHNNTPGNFSSNYTLRDTQSGVAVTNFDVVKFKDNYYKVTGGGGDNVAIRRSSSLSSLLSSVTSGTLVNTVNASNGLYYCKLSASPNHIILSIKNPEYLNIPGGISTSRVWKSTTGDSGTWISLQLPSYSADCPIGSFMPIRYSTATGKWHRITGPYSTTANTTQFTEYSDTDFSVIGSYPFPFTYVASRLSAFEAK